MRANGSTSKSRSAVTRGRRRSRRPYAFSPLTAQLHQRHRADGRRRFRPDPETLPRGCRPGKFGIGQAVRRVEDQRFTTGSGQFVADLALPRQCYGVAVLSPHAHAIIKRVDASAAKAAPGVLCVLTGADAETDKIGGIPPFFMPDSWGGAPGFPTTRPVLLADRVRCIGDRVAFVVAQETEAQGARRRARGGRLRAAAGARRSRAGGAARGAENLGAMPGRQCRGHDRVRRQGRGRCSLRQRQACRLGAIGQQPGDRQSDRASLCARRLRSRRRQIHALYNFTGSA